MFSLRGAADPTSDASSVEASGFELKLLKAQHSRKISEKLFEAGGSELRAPKHRILANFQRSSVRQVGLS